MATVRIDQKRHALVRAVPNSFTDALANFFGSGPSDVGLARLTHKAYCSTLEDNGVKVTVIPADDDYPDCIFVEDQAVIIDGHVLLPALMAPSRRGEQQAVADAIIEELSGHKVCKIHRAMLTTGASEGNRQVRKAAAQMVGDRLIDDGHHVLMESLYFVNFFQEGRDRRITACQMRVFRVTAWISQDTAVENKTAAVAAFVAWHTAFI